VESSKIAGKPALSRIGLAPASVDVKTRSLLAKTNVSIWASAMKSTIYATKNGASASSWK
jgi:hypothetical protein